MYCAYAHTRERRSEEKNSRERTIKKYINIVNGVTTHFYIYIFIFHLCPYLHDGCALRLIQLHFAVSLCVRYTNFAAIQTSCKKCEWPNSKSPVYVRMKFIHQINGFVRALFSCHLTLCPASSNTSHVVLLAREFARASTTYFVVRYSVFV